MSLGRAVHQKPGSPARNAGQRGEAAPEAVRDLTRTARHEAPKARRRSLRRRSRARTSRRHGTASNSIAEVAGWMDCRSLAPRTA